MVIYKYSSTSDAFHAIQEISYVNDAEVSFLSDKFIIPKNIDSLDVSSLPVVASLAPAAISSGEELMLHYKDRQAKGLFMSFPLEGTIAKGVVFRLAFFEVGFIAVSVLSKTRISLDVPEDVEEVLEKYGLQRQETAPHCFLSF